MRRLQLPLRAGWSGALRATRRPRMLFGLWGSSSSCVSVRCAHTAARLTPLSGLPPASLHAALVRPWPLEIRRCTDDDAKGFGLFVTRSVSAGETVFEERPIVCVEEAAPAAAAATTTTTSTAEDNTVLDEAEEQQNSAVLDDPSAVPPAATSASCAYCRAMLHPPTILEESSFDTADPVDADSAPVSWPELIEYPALLQYLSLTDPSRTPLASPTPCRTTLLPPSSPASEPGLSAAAADPPCTDRFCSPRCEAAAWESWHGREHLAEEDAARFLTQPALGEMLQDAEKQTILRLLLRIVALMQSSTSTSSATAGAKQSSTPLPSSPTSAAPPLSLDVLDHLSHLSALADLTPIFSAEELRALEHAFGPLLQRVVDHSPSALSQRLHDAGCKPASEGVFMLHGLLGALLSNSFRITHAHPMLTLRHDGIFRKVPASSTSSPGSKPRDRAGRSATAEEEEEDEEEGMSVMVRFPSWDAHCAATVNSSNKPPAAASPTVGGDPTAAAAAAAAAASEAADVATDATADAVAHFTHHASLFSLAAFMNHACAPHHNIAIATDHEPAAGAEGDGLQQPPTTTAATGTKLLPPESRFPFTRFVARRDLSAGEELLWLYAHDPTTLPVTHGFVCRCPTCAPQRPQPPRNK